MTEAFVVREPRAAALRALNYRPEVEAFRTRGAGRTKRLDEMAPDIGASYWQVFTRLDCDPASGVELLSQTDMFAAEPQGRVIRRESMPRPEIHSVRRWQVLIAGAGQMHEGTLFGRSIIADGRLVDRYLGPHAVGLRFEEEGGPENLWTYAFLNTATGLAAIKSCAFGTSVPGLRLDLLAALPIPLADDATVSRVASLVRKAVEQRERYALSIKAARQVIEDLPVMKEARGLCAERKACCITWGGELPTVCAWNFASTGGALSLLSDRWSGRLGDALEPEGLYYGLRCTRIDCDEPYGVPFLSQRDVFLIRPIPRQVRKPDVPDRYLFAPAGSLVMAGRGTLGEGEIFGRPTLVTPSMSKIALTEDLLRIRPRPEFEALVYAFSSTLVGLRLLRSTAVGTKILNLRADLLRRLPLPELGDREHEAVRQHVRDAVSARELAGASEAEAISIVEEVLREWLA